MRYVVLLLICLSSSLQLSSAGEQIVPSFTVGAKPLSEVLSHVQLKAVVAEFVDPADTGIGKSLGYLMWRETLTAISDQSGAGVILARTPGNERIVDMLERDYHNAAKEIAQHQKARMVLWGAVVEDGDQLYINTHLTMLTETGKSDLRLKYTPKYQRQQIAEYKFRSGAKPPKQTPIEAKIPRSRFNFTLVEASRDELFNRVVITRNTSNLRARPTKQSKRIKQVKGGAVLQAIDMEGAWFKIKLADGGIAYIKNELVDLPPKMIEAKANKINLRSGPGRNYKVIVNADLHGSFTVIDMSYQQGQGLWYGIKFRGEKAWVWAGLVRARFSLPAVHFLAGMYRFYGERFKDADREFWQFINAPDIKANNVNLATAYQLQGTSQLSKRRVNEVPEAFDKAVKLTPYDPSAYLIRAVAELKKPQTHSKAVADINKALQLDKWDKNTRAVLSGLSVAIEEEQKQTVTTDKKLQNIRGDIFLLKKQYQIKEIKEIQPLAPGSLHLKPAAPAIRRIENSE